jgi:hypothetical protein
MATQDPVSRSFTRMYRAAEALYDADLLDKCIELCYELLEDSACPHYHQIKTMVLLGACVMNFAFSQRLYQDAERLWGIVRAFNVIGRTKLQMKHFDELRKFLDAFKLALVQEAAERAAAIEDEDEDEDEKDEDFEGPVIP